MMIKLKDIDQNLLEQVQKKVSNILKFYRPNNCIGKNTILYAHA